MLFWSGVLPPPVTTLPLLVITPYVRADVPLHFEMLLQFLEKNGRRSALTRGHLEYQDTQLPRDQPIPLGVAKINERT